MKITKVRGFLKGKLKMMESKGPSHYHYLPLVDGKPFQMLTVIAVSFGAGEISQANEKGIAEAHGLSLHDFRTSTNCGISSFVCFVSAAAKALERTYLFLAPKDPLGHQWDHSFIDVASSLERSAIDHRSDVRNEEERAILSRWAEKLRAICGASTGRLAATANRVLFLIEEVL